MNLKKKKEEKKMGVYFGLVNYSMPTQFDWSENEKLFKQIIYFFLHSWSKVEIGISNQVFP